MIVVVVDGGDDQVADCVRLTSQSYNQQNILVPTSRQQS
jgi:hypothetical protein